MILNYNSWHARLYRKIMQVPDMPGTLFKYMWGLIIGIPSMMLFWICCSPLYLLHLMDRGFGSRIIDYLEEITIYNPKLNVHIEWVEIFKSSEIRHP